VAAWLDAARVESTTLPTPSARAELLGQPGSTTRPMQPVRAQWQRQADQALLNPLEIPLPYAQTLVPDARSGLGQVTGSEAARMSDAGANVQTYTVRLPGQERLRILTRSGAGARGGLIVDVIDPQRRREGLPMIIASFGPQPIERRIVVPPDTTARAEAGSPAPCLAHRWPAMPSQRKARFAADPIPTAPSWPTCRLVPRLPRWVGSAMRCGYAPPAA